MFTTTMGTKTLLKLTLLKLEQNYHIITSIRPSISYIGMLKLNFLINFCNG